MRTEHVELRSFDGGASYRVGLQEADKIRELEDPSTEGYRIARGGGYSYAAMSAGDGVATQSLTHFNRVFRRLVGESPTQYRQKLPHP